MSAIINYALEAYKHTPAIDKFLKLYKIASNASRQDWI